MLPEDLDGTLLLDGSRAVTLALAVPDVTLVQTLVLACDDGTFASMCMEAVPPGLQSK